MLVFIVCGVFFSENACVWMQSLCKNESKIQMYRWWLVNSVGYLEALSESRWGCSSTSLSTSTARVCRAGIHTQSKFYQDQTTESHKDFIFLYATTASVTKNICVWNFTFGMCTASFTLQLHLTTLLRMDFFIILNLFFDSKSIL